MTATPADVVSFLLTLHVAFYCLTHFKDLMVKLQRRRNKLRYLRRWSSGRGDELCEFFLATTSITHLIRPQAFITTLNQSSHQTYQELLRSLRLILNPRFSQRPQLGSAHHIVRILPLSAFSIDLRNSFAFLSGHESAICFLISSFYESSHRNIKHNLQLASSSMLLISTVYLLLLASPESPIPHSHLFATPPL